MKTQEKGWAASPPRARTGILPMEERTVGEEELALLIAGFLAGALEGVRKLCELSGSRDTEAAGALLPFHMSCMSGIFG